MSFNLLRVEGTLTGEYDGLGEGDLVGSFGGENLFITYAGGDGNDVALFTVPEPTMTLTWSMLIELAIMMQRRRCYRWRDFDHQHVFCYTRVVRPSENCRVPSVNRLLLPANLRVPVRSECRGTPASISVFSQRDTRAVRSRS